MPSKHERERSAFKEPGLSVRAKATERKWASGERDVGGEELTLRAFCCLGMFSACSERQLP